VGVLVLVGAAIGLPASYVLGRLIESQLFGVRAHDPLVLAGGALVILVAALLAGMVPALRAMRIEPLQALRYE
jgi:putative ABC transport system permease protein